MTFTKDPEAVLDYSIDWSRWLAGDQIVTSTWTVDGLEKVSDTQTATKTTVWLRGGTAGESYTVTNRITTSGGRTDDRSFLVRVEDR